MQAETNQHNRTTGARPAQCVMDRLLAADGIKNYFVTTDQHFVIKHSCKEFCSSCALYALVAVLSIKDMRCTHASSQFDLVGIASHDTHRSIRNEGANDL